MSKSITIFYLKTCNTCIKILDKLDLPKHALLREIKSEGITEKEIMHLHSLTGNFESFFSKKSMKYRALGLHEQTLTEKDFKKYILQEYTFLKRPVIVVDNVLFAGNANATVDAAYKAIHA